MPPVRTLVILVDLARECLGNTHPVADAEAVRRFGKDTMRTEHRDSSNISSGDMDTHTKYLPKSTGRIISLTVSNTDISQMQYCYLVDKTINKVMDKDFTIPDRVKIGLVLRADSSRLFDEDELAFSSGLEVGIKF